MASTGSGLRISLSGSSSFSHVGAYTFYQFTGDFDVQVDFSLGPGWSASFPGSDSSPQLNGGALTIYLDEPNWMMISRSRLLNTEGFSFYSNVDLGITSRNQFAPRTASSGSLRVVSSA